MAIIDFITNKLGEIVYPKTKTKAVFDDNDNRLDNVLGEMKSDLSNFIKIVEVTNSVPLEGDWANASYKRIFFNMSSLIPQGYKAIAYSRINYSVTTTAATGFSDRLSLDSFELTNNRIDMRLHNVSGAILPNLVSLNLMCTVVCAKI